MEIPTVNPNDSMYVDLLASAQTDLDALKTELAQRQTEPQP
jgi:hypothetical protein